jgi:hypothetical protein
MMFGSRELVTFEATLLILVVYTFVPSNSERDVDECCRNFLNARRIDDIYSQQDFLACREAQTNNSTANIGDVLDMTHFEFAGIYGLSTLSAWRIRSCLRSSINTLELFEERESSESPLLFWTSDLHDGIRADIVSSITSIGHRIIPGGHKLNESPHTHVFGHHLVEWPDLPLPPAILDRHGASDPLSAAEVRTTVAHYRDDPQMHAVDAFVCSFPAAFCEAWLPFRRPIVWWIGHRYALGRCSPRERARLHALLAKSAARGDVIASMSHYDAEYLLHYTGVRPPRLEGTALFYAGRAVILPPGAPAPPPRPEILIGPLNLLAHGAPLFLQELLRLESPRFALVKTLYPSFELADITAHPAAVPALDPARACAHTDVDCTHAMTAVSARDDYSAPTRRPCLPPSCVRACTCSRHWTVLRELLTAFTMATSRPRQRCALPRSRQRASGCPKRGCRRRANRPATGN